MNSLIIDHDIERAKHLADCVSKSGYAGWKAFNVTSAYYSLHVIKPEIVFLDFSLLNYTTTGLVFKSQDVISEIGKKNPIPDSKKKYIVVCTDADKIKELKDQYKKKKNVRVIGTSLNSDDIKHTIDRLVNSN